MNNRWDLVTVHDTGKRDFNEKYDEEYATEGDQDYNEPYSDARFNDIAPHDLYLLKDEINDKTNLSESVEYDRSGVYIYYNGVVYLSPNEAYKTHSELSTSIEENKCSVKDIKEFRRDYQRDSDRNRSFAVSYGHLCNGAVAVIDPITNTRNINSDIIKNALKEAGMNKVYILDVVDDFDMTKVKRLAKKMY